MPSMDIISDEEYIIKRAKDAQTTDSDVAKAWMLTAKTLFPANFNVQFEAYLMEKASGHIQEAASCLSSLISSGDIPNDLWPEIEAITNALKSNGKSFLVQMFDCIQPDIQHKLLLACAEHCDNTMEYCKVLLLLLKKFPQLIGTYCNKLVDTLYSAEKHCSDNRYARLLVVDLLPLLGSPQSPRLLQRLLVKAIDFYNTYINQDTENDINDPWLRLYSVLELLGKQHGWDPYLLNYSNSLNKESYFQKLITLRNDDDCRQLLYCGTIFLLRSLNEQNSVKGNHILVEAFSDPELPSLKRRKSETEITGITAHQFQVAANCWELLHCNDIISREFMKLTNQLQVKIWQGIFTDELALYRGRYEEAMPKSSPNNLAANLMMTSIAYCQNQYSACLEFILAVLAQLPNTEGVLETELVVGGSHRHLHFLPLTKMAVVHYCSTLLSRSLVANGEVTDMAIGHALVLMQLGWPQDETVYLRLIEIIRQQGVFRYPLFQSYIIHIDILEEIVYLWTEQGGNIVLDILPNTQQHLGQRRIGTRGADKGVKEDFKQAMKAQVTRCNDSLINLILQFITQERMHILQCLIR